jgi:hypothetical protein
MKAVITFTADVEESKVDTLWWKALSMKNELAGGADCRNVRVSFYAGDAEDVEDATTPEGGTP